MRVPYAPPGERLLKRSSAARVAGIGGHRLYRAADVVALRDRLEALEQEAPQ